MKGADQLTRAPRIASHEFTRLKTRVGYVAAPTPGDPDFRQRVFRRFAQDDASGRIGFGAANRTEKTSGSAADNHNGPPVGMFRHEANVASRGARESRRP